MINNMFLSVLLNIAYIFDISKKIEILVYPIIITHIIFFFFDLQMSTVKELVAIFDASNDKKGSKSKGPSRSKSQKETNHPVYRYTNDNNKNGNAINSSGHQQSDDLCWYRNNYPNGCTNQQCKRPHGEKYFDCPSGGNCNAFKSGDKEACGGAHFSPNRRGHHGHGGHHDGYRGRHQGHGGRRHNH